MTINPFIYLDDTSSRGILISIEISDIHFGVLNPEYQYNILQEQFIYKIKDIPFNLISINGDLFDHKLMASNLAIMYAIQFIDDLVKLCREKQATLLLLYGTEEHDANQYRLFYKYLNDPTIDIRIVEQIEFHYIHNARILCIPELYDRDRNYYNNFLFYNGEYDSVRMHGTVKNSVYGTNIPSLDSHRAIFDIKDFGLCKGPIVCGHVHTPGCFDKYMYYTGTPLRFRFGEEEDKGFIVLLHNLDTGEHYAHFETIKSMRYDTINLDTMIKNDPQEVISYLKNLQSNGIDNIKAVFTEDNESNINIIKNYFRRNSNIKIETVDKNKDQIIKDIDTAIREDSEYSYLVDPTLSEYDRLVRYINDKQGYVYITVDKLISLLSE